MREIKFRAWDLVKQQMVADEREVHYYLGSSKEERALQRPHIFLMFTGLLDTKDNEVWEGDIVKTGNDLRWEVCFGEFTVFDNKQENEDFIGWHLHSIENIKVRSHILDQETIPMHKRMRLERIGNIYETRSC